MVHGGRAYLYFVAGHDGDLPAFPADHAVVCADLLPCAGNGPGADEFLGTQGDPWDTQSDMLFAFIGAMSAMVLLSRWHDSEMRRVEMHKVKQGDSV
ncbi:MAG TPA: DUF2238 domain-containing protein [Gallionella sp.]|nr:DUF2238 domain-containing protein [Gallionella sp.]